MKKHHLHGAYIFILFTVLLLYAGCTPSSSNQGTDYRYGSQGLELSFYPENTKTFYEGEDATLFFELRNKGTADIRDGQLFASGFDRTYLNFQFRPSQFFSITGKDQFDPSGQYAQQFSLVAQNARMPPNRERFSQSVLITACYTYETKATAEVCVDPDPLNRQTRDKVCNLGVRNSGAQGHPITISSITPTVNANAGTVRFQIQFTNSGGGQVYDRRVSHSICNSGLAYNEIDVVYVNSVQLGNMRLQCEPANPVRMLNGQGMITCTCNDCVDTTMSAYWSVLDMELSYGYKNTIRQDITLRTN